MKFIRITSGIFVFLLGITMMVFAWYFFFQEETAIIQLSSLYVALFLSILVTTIGIMFITFRKGD